MYMKEASGPAARGRGDITAARIARIRTCLILFITENPVRHRIISGWGVGIAAKDSFTSQYRPEERSISFNCASPVYTAHGIEPAVRTVLGGDNALKKTDHQKGPGLESVENRGSLTLSDLCPGHAG